MKSWSKIVLPLAIATLVVISGCSSNQASQYPSQVSAGSHELAATNLAGASVKNPRLEALWSARRNDLRDFAVGPGDVLEIQVPAVKELQDQTVRVDGKGDIDLPLLGSMHVAGLSERDLDGLLVEKLSNYLYHPEADVFVKSYSSRQVAVTGEVRTPGTYTLNGPEDTIRALIQRAGGLTDHASTDILVTPESNDATDSVMKVSARVQDDPPNVQQSDPPGEDSVLQLRSPLVVDLKRDAKYLDIPVRPGDALYVPAAGSISTVGWVQHPTTLPVVDGLSVIGAIAASGGSMYAADLSNVKIIRRKQNGQIDVIYTNITSIQNGTTPDIPLRNGDIVDVSYSAAKIPGYALYYAAQGVLSWAPAAMLVSGVP